MNSSTAAPQAQPYFQTAFSVAEFARRRAAVKARKFDSLAQEAFLNLWRTYDRLREEEESLFARHDLTPQQYNALRLLRGEHPGTLATLGLAGRLVSRAPDITRLVDKLADRGLVDRRRPADNRRQVRIGITPAGLTLLGELDHGLHPLPRPVRTESVR